MEPRSSLQGFSTAYPTKPGFYLWCHKEGTFGNPIGVFVYPTQEGNLIAEYPDGPEYLPPYPMAENKGEWGPKVSDNWNYVAFLLEQEDTEE